MKILKIKLDNIKSYEDGPIINLHQGVNFISGKNGSGKTTLLESIGYGIFDFCRYTNISKMLREGTKSGKITVWFSFEDERVYRSERKITQNSSTWTVYEDEDETEIVSGAKEVLSWIKEMMGLQEEVNTSQIYSEIIGVSQGEITTYFKITSEAKRRDHFSPIISVEDYKKAYTETSSVPSNLKFQIQEIESKISQIKAKTEKYEIKKEEMEKVNADLKKIDEDLKKKNDEVKKAEKSFEDLNKKKEALGNRQTEIELLGVRLKSNFSEKKRLDENFKSAQSAKEIISKSSQGYKIYIETTKELEKAEKDIRKKAEILAKKNKLLANKQTLEKEVEITNKTNKESLNKNSIEIDTEEKSLKSILPKYEKTRKDLTLVENKLTTFNETKEISLDDLKELINLTTKNNEKIEENKKRVDKLKKSIGVDGLKKELDINKIQKEIKDIQKKITLNEEKTGALKEKAESYKISLKKGGVCPLLNEPCKLVSKKTLSKKIEENLLELKKINEESIVLEDKIEKLNVEKEKAIRFNANRSQAKEKQKELRDLEKESKDLNDQISPLEINKRLTGINRKLLAIGITAEISSIKDKNLILDYLRKIKSDISKKLSDGENKVSAEKTKLDKLLTNYETNKEKFLERIKKLQIEKNKLSSSQQILVKKVRELESILIEIKNIETEEKAYVNSETEMEKIKITISKNKKSYDDYQKNINESANLDKLKISLDRLNIEISDQQKKSKLLGEEIANIGKEYSEETYLSIKSSLEKFKEEKIKAESAKAEFTNKHKDLITLIEEMEKELLKIVQLELDKKKLQETGSVIDLIRKVLNEVGKPIAQRYLDSLSASANMIYNTLSDEKVVLTWESDYMIRLTNTDGTREFTQLSGGEQMCAALSVQLALAREFSRVGIAIFDEPTSNLDDTRKDSLSDTIAKVREEYGFNQLFIISHDSTFSNLTEEEIHLEKVNGKTVLT